MALIGSLTIGMGVNIAGLQKGLLGSSGLINQFGQSLKLAGGGWGMLAVDSAKFVRGVAEDFSWVGKITAKSLGIAGGAVMAFGGGSLNVLRDFGGMARAAGARINAFGSNVYTVGKQMGVALLAGGAAAGYGIMKAVTAGSDMIENQNMIKATFGASAGYVIESSKKMGAAFGSSQKEFQISAGMLGGIFKNMGYGTDDAAKLSVEMIKLAADLQSFKNIPFDEALHKITSGLTGEAKGLKEVGINLLETVITEEAYRMGIAKVGSELTEQQKVQARLSSLMKQTKDAQGDLARTSDDVANATKGLSGRFENLIATLGERLQPVAKVVLSDLSTGISVISDMWSGASQSVLDTASTTIGSAQQQTTSIGFIQGAVGKVADAWQSVQKIFLAVHIKITEGLIYMVENVSGFAEGIGKIVSYFTGIEMAAGDFTKTWLEDLKTLNAEQLKTFEMKDTAKPFSEEINKAFDAARVKTAAIRSDLAKSNIDVTKLKPVSEAVTKKAEKQTNTAASFGSSEAANMILKSQFGGDQTAKDNKKIADNTSKANVHLEQIARGIAGFAGRGGAMAWDNF